MGYNGSSRKGYDVRYRGFPKSSKRSIDSMFFGRHGILINAAKLLDAGFKDLTFTPAYSRSKFSGTNYVYRTAPDKAQKSLLNIDFQEVSNDAYIDVIADYTSRREQFEQQLAREQCIYKVLNKKSRSLRTLKYFRFLFNHRAESVSTEIEILSKQLEKIHEQRIDTSLTLEGVSPILDQRFVDSFMALFDGTSVFAVRSSESIYSPNEIPSYCHHFEIGRGPIKFNTETGPITNAKCCSIILGDIVVYFYSSVLVLTNASKEIAIVSYRDLTMSIRSISIVESEGFSTYGNDVRGYEYLHEKKKGGPDLRYSYNPSRPICHYYNLVLRQNKKILFNILSNKEDLLKAFMYSFSLMKGNWYYMDEEHLSEDTFSIIANEADVLSNVRKICNSCMNRIKFSLLPYVHLNSSMVENHVLHMIFSDLHSILVENVKEEGRERGMWAMLYIATRVLNYYSMYKSYNQLSGVLNHAPQIYSSIQKRLNYEIPEGFDAITIDYLLSRISADEVNKYHSSICALRRLVE